MKFEQFLQAKHFEENPHILDDDLPDQFEAWIVELDIETLCKFADEFANLMVENTIKQLR